MNQEEIILKLKRGDETVFADVVSYWQDMIYNTAISIVHNEEDAEDIAQEVFVQLYRSIKNFREEATLSTWLYRVTIRKALDVEKMKSRQKRGGLFKHVPGIQNETEQIHFNHPGVLAENKEQAAILFEALKKIPEKQRIAFTLQKIEGMDYREIAAIMDTTLSAVESLLTRAKNNLKKILSAYYNESA